MKCIFKGVNSTRADLIFLILSARYIHAEIAEYEGGGFCIRVSEQDVSRARGEVDGYDRENLIQPRPGPVSEQSAFFSWAVCALILILAVIHYLSTRYDCQDTAFFRYGVSSYFISKGEAFRAVTALFLHSDAGHLLGNMAGLMVLGGPLARLCGYGSGLFLLLCAGTTGNLVAAAMGNDLVISIGASTAVMGAAGLLAAGQMTRSHRHPGRFRLSPILPLAAAATLVAMFSHGDHTDVLAHFTGFAAGVVLGFAGFPLIRVCRSPFTEKLCLGISVLIVIAAAVQGIP